MSAFEVGKVYTMRSVGDHNATWTYRVISRTAKTMVLLSPGQGMIKRGIGSIDGIETCYPLGRYSFAPVLKADKVVVEKEISE